MERLTIDFIIVKNFKTIFLLIQYYVMLMQSFPLADWGFYMTSCMIDIVILKIQFFTLMQSIVMLKFKFDLCCITLDANDFHFWTSTLFWHGP